MLEDGSTGAALAAVSDPALLVTISREVHAAIDRGVRQPIEPVLKLAVTVSAFETAARKALGQSETARRWSVCARRAERLAGQHLLRVIRRGRPASDGTRVGNGDPASPFWQTLADLGVTRRQSAAWQWLARCPEEDFEREVRRLGDLKEEPTRARLVRYAKKVVNPTDPTANRWEKVREAVQARIDAVKVEGPNRVRGELVAVRMHVVIPVTVTAVETPDLEVVADFVRGLLPAGTFEPWPGDYVVTIEDVNP
jgi:hypothetical protein